LYARRLCHKVWRPETIAWQRCPPRYLTTPITMQNKGKKMRFYQMMEFRSTTDDAVAEIKRFKDLMDGETTARRATVCVDRDDPGLIVQIIEFDSYDEAMKNSEHETTQAESAKIEDSSGGVSFRNLDVVEVIDI
jgi:hypothetical protein